MLRKRWTSYYYSFAYSEALGSHGRAKCWILTATRQIQYQVHSDNLSTRNLMIFMTLTTKGQILAAYFPGTIFLFTHFTKG
jgi:hypothetical protein